MKTSDIINALSHINNGRLFKIHFESDLASKVSATAKKQGVVVIKSTHATVRKGIRYDNIKRVKEMRTGGELPATNGGLSWGEWLIDKLIIGHKGKEYLRLYTSRNKSKTEYIVNGKSVTYAELKNLGIMQPSFFSNNGDKEKICYNVETSNIVSIG